MGQHSEAELNRKFIETAKLMNIYLNHFPKFEKYALAQQIRQRRRMIEVAMRQHHKGNTDVFFFQKCKNFCRLVTRVH